MRKISLPLLLTAVLVACGDNSGTPETVPPDTSAASAADSARVAIPILPFGSDFEETAFRAYTRMAVAVPPSVSDSLFRATKDKLKIPQEMERLMARYDSLARIDVADHFAITVDSLDRIIAKGNSEKWEDDGTD